MGKLRLREVGKKKKRGKERKRKGRKEKKKIVSMVTELESTYL